MNEAEPLINRLILEVNFLQKEGTEIKNNPTIKKALPHSIQDFLNQINSYYDECLEKMNETENKHQQLTELIDNFLKSQDDYTYQEEKNEQLNIVKIKKEISTLGETTGKNTKQKKTEIFTTFFNFRNELNSNLPLNIGIK